MTVTQSDLDAFIVKAQAMLTAHDERSSNVTRTTISYAIGKHYARLIVSIYTDQHSAYGFVDLTSGDLLKSDGWKSPAKGKRGNIFDANSLAGCTPYGMVYAR